MAAGERRGQEEGITKAFPYSNRRLSLSLTFIPE